MCSRFSIIETHFTYQTSILETPFTYETLIPESSKIIKIILVI